MFKALPAAMFFCLWSSTAYSDGSIDLSRSQPAVHSFNQGVQHFNAKEYSEAVPFFDEAISQDSDFAEAYYARGACRYSLKNVDGAVMDLSDAIRLKSELLDARALRGVIYYESDQSAQALDDFNYVLAHNPKDAQSLLGRGVILLKQEDVTGAERDFHAFLRLRPNDPMAPRLRKLLASLKSPSAEPEAKASSEGEGSSAPAAAAPAARRPSAAVQAMADSLMRRNNDLSDQYTRKVLQGDRSPVVGDPNAPSNTPSNSGGVDIVEPH